VFFKYLTQMLLFLALLPPTAEAITLKEAYESAQPAHGYDRYVELETGVTYTGGLLIGRVYSIVSNSFNMVEEGVDVCIIGNGAILDLEGEQLCISYCSNRLDIENCIVINGNIRFRGDNDPGPDIQPEGSVRHVTFYQPHDYGVRLQGAGDGILVERNLIIDTIDTGVDFIPSTGMPGTLIPTGTAISASVQTGDYGYPIVKDNWTWFSDFADNSEPLHHFSFL